MTDQTVLVPVDLLRSLRSTYPSTVDGEPNSPIAQLAALIPAPPKVGDKLTADEAAKLPWRSVVVDKDGDPWVRDAGDGGRAYLYNDEEPSRMTPGYEPFILVHLGRD